MGIPTTHPGSVPRPPELTRFPALRARGDAVDDEARATAGRKATHGIAARQMEVGITIGNNGDQQREGFFLCVRDRMSGFGGRLEASRTPRRGAGRASNDGQGRPNRKRALTC